MSSLVAHRFFSFFFLFLAPLSRSRLDAGTDVNPLLFNAVSQFLVSMNGIIVVAAVVFAS